MGRVAQREKKSKVMLFKYPLFCKKVNTNKKVSKMIIYT